MSKLTGVFDYFQNLDEISILDIDHWIKKSEQHKSLENFIGNRIIYSQTIPLSSGELEIDYAILREAIKNKPEFFFDNAGRKILILQDFLDRFPPFEKFIKVLVETINPQGINSIFLKKRERVILVGTIIMAASLPNIQKLNKTINTVNITVNSREFKLNLGEIYILPERNKHLRVKIDNLNEILVDGGELGLVMDLRL